MNTYVLTDEELRALDEKRKEAEAQALKEFLEHPETLQVAEDVKEQKAQEVSSTGKRIITDQQVDSLLEEPSIDNLNTIINSSVAEDDLRDSKRALFNVNHYINERKGKKQSPWQNKKEHVINNVPLELVVDHFLGECRPMMRCPFHEDKTASMKVSKGVGSAKTGLFFCHACGAKGNAINFTRLYKDLSFKEAVRYLYNLQYNGRSCQIYPTGRFPDC